MEAASLGVELGEFLWHELFTTDLDAAEEFYGEVLGWEMGEYVNDAGELQYYLWHAEGVPVAGVAWTDPESPQPMEPHWTAYLHTPDIEHTLDLAEELSDLPRTEPFDAMIGGHAAGFMDNVGSSLWLLQPDGSGPMPKRPIQGSFTWNVLSTFYLTYAIDYYRDLFGWEMLDRVDLDDDRSYWTFGKGGKAYGAIHNVQFEPEIMPWVFEGGSQWLHYANVGDLVEALARVNLHGGRIISGPKQDPLGVRIAHCVDPQGAIFALREATE